MRRTFVVSTALFSLFLGLPPSSAAFPGQNGVIAYVFHQSDDISYTDNYIAYKDGDGNEHVITDPEETVGDPVWASDGDQLAYQVCDGPCWINTIDLESSTPQQVTSSAPLSDESPTWSPDGSRIAFSRCGKSGCDLWYVDLTTDEEVRLTSTGASEINPSWSPDGTRIVFGRSKGEMSAIYVGRLLEDGFRVRGLKSSAGAGVEAINPDWHPSGKVILFRRNVYRGSPKSDDLYTIRPDGTHRKRLTTSRSRAEGGAVWSPDGTQIAYAYFYSDGGCDIGFLRSDGSEIESALRHGEQVGTREFRASSHEDPCYFNPAWQPVQDT